MSIHYVLFMVAASIWLQFIIASTEVYIDPTGVIYDVTLSQTDIVKNVTLFVIKADVVQQILLHPGKSMILISDI